MTAITVTYWRGTLRCKGTATTYRGAKRIASRNSNAWGPNFYDEAGEKLYDDGHGLAYDETDEDTRLGRRRYAV